MHALIRIFIRGLLALFPLVVTVSVVVYSFKWLNSITSRGLELVAPELPQVPGTGIVLGAGAILVLGVLVSSRLTRWLYHWVEAPFRHIPVVKELYMAIKELTDYLSPAQREAAPVVLVKLPHLPVEIVGLLMRADLAELPDPIDKVDKVAVYLPMSYQIGGFTLFLPKDWTRPVDIPVETAMRQALTGWLRYSGQARG